MADMLGDIVNRVKRLPKPSNNTEALQPLFEAISNAIHAVDDRFKEHAPEHGHISVSISNLGDVSNLEIVVRDNGVGLERDRFNAFRTTDTPFKIERGGKGIGRLLWLDAFDQVSVDSTFMTNGSPERRVFDFQLTSTNQIAEHPEFTASTNSQTGTVVRFKGLRGTAYQKYFPAYPKTLIRHFGSHFLADFILGRCPRIDLSVNGETTQFPEGVTAFLVEKRPSELISTEEYGELKLSNFVFRKEASSEFDGLHQLHFIAGRRTVITRKIDGLLGVGRFGDENDYVYHGCVEGTFLDERVNQERTYFNFSDQIAEDIAKLCAERIRKTSLEKEVTSFDAGRLSGIQRFLEVYPSFQFDTPEELLSKTPKNATKPEEFARALIPHRIRRDNERRNQVQEIVAKLNSEDEVPEDFAVAVRKAADDVRAEEQRQLTEYVLRRKMALDVLEVLIRRVRETASGERIPHLEQTLHKFICPMRVRGDDARRIEATDHDLWIIDERLAFARYFASDVPFTQIIEESRNSERPDLLIFDRLHGLGIKGEDPLERIMLVELKHPGRTDYDEKYLPGNQIIRYLHELSGGTIMAYNGEDLRISKDCVFHCFVVADIVGKLKVHTSGWETTANGRGKWMALKGDYRGSIEIIEWKDLIKDARLRSHAFTHAAGM
ncbi:ATP-binding protein [Microvirga arsenatis]|uniref:ATP-binding protein n=1 Tax=Microvirga arsenatis TaxID=2692265 RepID=A0ABW9YUR8_9HYPH|nr:ATP-binding protein [Microvirga arsenatis]NBJ10177.1 ATP-binding protein [Microvirga arsenatis]NBJ23245.1 ATP-binding protein [Microvirga arsenatis]